jgi:hypothetical protein
MILTGGVWSIGGMVLTGGVWTISGITEYVRTAEIQEHVTAVGLSE